MRIYLYYPFSGSFFIFLSLDSSPFRYVWESAGNTRKFAINFRNLHVKFQHLHIKNLVCMGKTIKIGNCAINFKVYSPPMSSKYASFAIKNRVCPKFFCSRPPFFDVFIHHFPCLYQHYFSFIHQYPHFCNQFS